MPIRDPARYGETVKHLAPRGWIVLGHLMPRIDYRSRRSAVNCLKRYGMGKLMRPPAIYSPGHRHPYVITFWAVKHEDAQRLVQIRSFARLSRKNPRLAKHLRDYVWGQSAAQHVKRWTNPAWTPSGSPTTTSIDWLKRLSELAQMGTLAPRPKSETCSDDKSSENSSSPSASA